MDQRLSVTSNFTGQYGRDIIKWTDTAPDAAGGSADWNYRMKWRTVVPCKVPRLKFQLWSAGMISDGEACGEVLYNLQPFFNRVVRDKLKDGVSLPCVCQKCQSQKPNRLCFAVCSTWIWIR
jgi:hypothetical protein